MEAKNYYDDYWSEKGYNPESSGSHRKLMMLLATHVDPNSTVIDIGCGDASSYAKWIVDQGNLYHGVDVSSNAIDSARNRGFEASLIEDASKLPFEDASVDVIICVEVLEHLFQPQSALAEAYRILKPGGKMIATVPNVAYWRRRADMAFLGRWNPVGDDLSVEQPWRDPHIRFFGEKTFGHMFKMAGFQIVSLGGHGGAILRDVPGLRRLSGGELEEKTYSNLEQRWPALFSSRLDIVAQKST